MPRPSGPRTIEKSKNFKGSMIRLLKNLNPWKYIMSMALILALVSAILALIAPNKLSDFADTISAGLVPNTEMMQKVAEKINKNMATSLTQEKMVSLFTEVNLSKKEMEQVTNIFSKINNASSEGVSTLLFSLPDNVLEYLIQDIKLIVF